MTFLCHIFGRVADFNVFDLSFFVSRLCLWISETSFLTSSSSSASIASLLHRPNILRQMKLDNDIEPRSILLFFEKNSETKTFCAGRRSCRWCCRLLRLAISLTNTFSRLQGFVWCWALSTRQQNILIRAINYCEIFAQTTISNLNYPEQSCEIQENLSYSNVNANILDSKFNYRIVIWKIKFENWFHSLVKLITNQSSTFVHFIFRFLVDKLFTCCIAIDSLSFYWCIRACHYVVHNVDA